MHMHTCMHVICEVGVGLRLHAFVHAWAISTRMHAMWARVGQPAGCLLARERMWCSVNALNSFPICVVGGDEDENTLIYFL